VKVEEIPGEVRISLNNLHKPHILNVHLNERPKKVVLDNGALIDSVNYTYDEKRSRLIIKTDSYSQGYYSIYM